MCSKMSQLHVALEEQLAELGFETLEEAALNGYMIDYENQTLVRTCTRSDINWGPVDQAHEDWEKEKAEVVADLKSVQRTAVLDHFETDTLDRAIDFIKRSSM